MINSNTHTTRERWRRAAKIVFKTVLWIISIPVILLVLIILLLQVPQVQSFVTGKATGFLSEKIHTKVGLKKVSIAFPKAIELQGLYIEDQKADTLLYLGQLKVDVNLWDLLSKKIVINNINLNSTTGHVYRNVADSTFNFNFIVDAFVKPDTTTVKPEEKDTTSSAWQFSIKHVELHALYLTFHDLHGGISADVQLGNFETGIETFDLLKKTIAVKSVSLDDTRVVVSQGKSYTTPKAATPSEPFAYHLSLKALALENINAVYYNLLSKQHAVIALGELLVEPRNIDIEAGKIDVKRVLLSKTTASYAMDKPVELKDSMINITVADTLRSSSPDWVITLGELGLEDNNFCFDNNTFQKKINGIDYNHLYAKQMSLHAKDITGSAKFASLKLDDLSFEEQCGFTLKTMQAGIVYDTSHVSIDGLLIETGHSSIKDHLSARYKSLERIGEDIGNLYVSARLKNSTIAVKDILYFVPDLSNKTSLGLNKNAVFRLNTNIKGIVNDLTLSEFELETMKSTRVAVKGSLRHVMDPQQMYLKLSTIDIHASRTELFDVISDKIIPKSVVIPETFSLKGNIEGYLKNFSTQLTLNSSIGNVIADVKMNPHAGNREQPYQGTVSLDQFDAGKLLNQSKVIGPVTLDLKVNGIGVSLATINTTVDLLVQSAYLNGYEYKGLNVNGKVVKKSFVGKASINDQNLAFDFDGLVNFDSLNPKYVFTFDLKGADLRGLNITTEDTRISTFIQSDITQQGDYILGKASVKKTLLIKKGKKYPVDSLVLTSTLKEGISDIQLRSEILDANIKGILNLKELPAMLTQQVNGYFNMQQSVVKKEYAAQKFEFNVNLKDPRLIVENLVPNLEKLEPSFITGSYNSEVKELKADLSVPQVKYSGTTVDSIRFRINSDASALQYGLTIAEVSNPTIKFENTSLSGNLKDDALSFGLSTSRDDSIKLLAIGGVLKNIDKTYELKLNPDLTLNAQKWNIDQTNYLQFAKEGLIANNVIISNGAQLISVNSLSKTPAAPLELNFKNFDLAMISGLLENKKELVKGEMNGKVVLEKQNNVSAFSSDLVISNFVFQSVPIGTIKVKADNKQNANVYALDVNVNGNGNDIAIQGTYNVANTNEALNLVLDIKNLNLATVEPFTFGQVTRMSGGLNGKLAIKGKAALPDLDGTINFKQSALDPEFLSSYLTIPDAHLNINSNKIIFPDFTVIDSLNNKAIISGSVDMKDLKNIDLDLRVRSDNFLALNTTVKDNPLYFGTVFLDSDVRIKGTTNSPDIKVKAKLNKGSGITYVKPESEVGKAENQGIVEFVDSLNYDKKIMTRAGDTLKQANVMKGIDVDATITFDKTVMLKMLVDQASGDSLFIVGGGTLDFILDKSGKTSLTGKYRIDDGGYHLSISEVVKRDFRIEPGSSVSWSGDILDAYVDIKAIYTIKTSPIDLIQNDLAGVDELERNKYRNMLTFFVYLKMSGFLTSPEISFDIQLAPKDKGAVNGTVNAKLEELRGDETQLNKQVFALLTLRRFISDNPLDNGGGGGGLSSASRTSASKVLTQQLSSLSEKYVKFVDLDLGVNSFEDYSTGQEEGRTQLQVGVSKQLFQDKVTIRVGGNVELEGEKAKQNNASDVAGNISIDYKLTDDGRYKLKGFRQNQYENPIEGEIIKTGVGVVYVRNYNKLRELFSKPKSAKKKTDLKTK